jgi:hypothetical protein
MLTPGIDLVDRLAKALRAAAGDLLPAEAAPETPAALQEQVRQLVEELVEHADRDVLVAVNAFLTLMRELTTRRR